jgi:hypothetical protein
VKTATTPRPLTKIAKRWRLKGEMVETLARRKLLVKTSNPAGFSILQLRVFLGRPLPLIFMAVLERPDWFATRRRP